jgi:hypothetical protein
MRVIKPKGESATETRKGRTHGSTAERRVLKWGGQLARMEEKPRKLVAPDPTKPRNRGRR